MHDELAVSPIPPGVEKRFAGQWVAIRNGAVVAAASNLGELSADPNVNPEDLRYLVPAGQAAI